MSYQRRKWNAARRQADTVADVFILESLTFEDETARRYDGLLLRDALQLCGKSPEYYYFRSTSELPALMDRFKQSRYRYLHLSCHGSASSVSTTLDVLTYDQFATYLGNYLPLRRLICSACELGNADFTRAIASVNKGMHSIVAPSSAIYFAEAAVLWSALYVSLFASDENAIKTADLIGRLRLLSKLFSTSYFAAAYHADKDDWKFHRIEPADGGVHKARVRTGKAIREPRRTSG